MSGTETNHIKINTLELITTLQGRHSLNYHFLAHLHCCIGLILNECSIQHFLKRWRLKSLEINQNKKKNIFEIKLDSKSSKTPNWKKTFIFCFYVNWMDWICTSLFWKFFTVFGNEEDRQTSMNTDGNVQTFNIIMTFRDWESTAQKVIYERSQSVFVKNSD